MNLTGAIGIIGSFDVLQHGQDHHQVIVG